MERVNVRQELSHYRLPNLKDSKLMTPEDRNTIIDLLKSSTSDKVIVTIGTFGMQEAYECARRANVPDKTIIFTGSSLPLA
jgi:L-asparaginase/Glu-tRNA(Gln) amidotransferase subunit D